MKPKTEKNLNKHLKKYQYHLLMRDKHKKKARTQWCIMRKIFKNDEEALKNYLATVGDENRLFNIGKVNIDDA